MLKFSIITIVYNRKDQIADTIQSVLKQDYKNFEYIIVDGGSTDGTIDIINLYKSQISILISEKDEGLYDAINKGINLATGDIIGLIHAGDLLIDNTIISRLAEKFEKSGADIVYGNTLLVTEEDINKVSRVWAGGDFKRKKFLSGWMPSHISVYIKRKIFLEHGLYRLDLPIASDYELLLRFMYKYKVSSAYFDDVIARFRIGGVSNKNAFYILEANKQCYKAWKLNGLYVPFYTIPLKILRRIPDFLFKSKRLKKYGYA
jgi:glycosyltransferase involved in cell wall biosynthesis